MKTIVEINSNNYASTGTIMLNIAKEARLQGYNVITCSKNSLKARTIKNDNHIYIGLWLERIISEKLAFLTGFSNHFNVIGTLLFIQKIKKINPDIIHIHSLIDTYINIDLLFRYIKTCNIPVVWTAHDVWNVSGQCITFDLVNCEKWKIGCGNCPLYHNYPATLFDRSNKQYLEKIKWFSGIKNMTIITPSIWLAKIISQSYQNQYNIKTIYNGIDTNIFKPTQKSIKCDKNLIKKHIVLGVSYGWSYDKGLDVFIELSKRLKKDYQIVLVGTNSDTDKKLPNNIISIHKTYNKKELVEIYSSADVFVNATRADNFPTVNIEALACGTPVITFNTGGSPEAIDNTCGKVVDKNDIDALQKGIIDICENKPFTKEHCINRAKQFDAHEKYNEYIKLFDSILTR